jgi:hypothetical protein
MDDFLRVMDPNRNGVADAFNPKKNGVEDWANNTFSSQSINQQNTILKGVFSTKKEDKDQGNVALMAPANGALASGIYDHPTNEPNKYDPVYNPKGPKSDKPASSMNLYLIGGGLLVVFFLMNRR